MIYNGNGVFPDSSKPSCPKKQKQEREKSTLKTHQNTNLHSIARSGIIAALYLLLTLISQSFAFGAIQFRLSEALMLLSLLTRDAVPGLFVGCLLANLLCGGVWYDVILGALATLLAAVLMRKYAQKTYFCAALPALVNGIIVGPVVYFAYVHAPGAPISWIVLFGSMLSVMLGEAVVCFVLGLPLVRVLSRRLTGFSKRG